jgi:hypothetical protein
MEPDPDDPELWLPHVDVVIACRGSQGRPYRFLLDTGAGQTWIRVDAETAGLPVVGTKQSRGVFGTMTDELVTLKSLTLGPIAKSGLTVVRRTRDALHGLVGMDVLGGTAMVLDLHEAFVDFVPSGSVPASWPLRRAPNGQPFLELQFPGVSALSCWDTGASMTVVDASFYASHEELFTPIGTSIGTDAVGQSQGTPIYLMAACTVGEITLAPQRVATAPLPQDPMPMDILLGYPAISQYTWTMDYPLNRWSASIER